MEENPMKNSSDAS